jgi:hypothetical protein
MKQTPVLAKEDVGMAAIARLDALKTEEGARPEN